MNLSIGNDQLPALYRSADAASIDAQRRYLRLFRADLVLIVLGAGLTAVSVSQEAVRSTLAMLAAAVLVGSLVLTGAIGGLHHNRNWYGGRAVAESVKTVSWRFMTCAEPYLRSMSPPTAEALLCQRLNEVLRDRSAVAGALGGAQASADQITEEMRQLRGASLEDRRKVYLRDRIQDQRVWYAKKAKQNSTSSSRWLAATAGAQLMAVVGAIVVLRYSTFPISPAPVFAALAAALLAWLQVKQHTELAHSYGLAAHELGLIEVRASHASNEDQFAAFVADAENAISREHTMWTARRDVAQ